MAAAGFYELGLPVSDHSSGKIDWCMRNEGSESYYLLNHTPHVGDLLDYDDSEFYFDSESSVHAHAAGYYSNYGKVYPYKEQWNKSLRRESGIEEDDAITNSQTMEFI